MFENKNLIFVVAESYSEIGVDEKRTPTLYKLIHNGFTFDNFYVLIIYRQLEEKLSLLRGYILIMLL